jgi:hypothetical protein
MANLGKEFVTPFCAFIVFVAFETWAMKIFVAKITSSSFFSETREFAPRNGSRQ